MVRLAIARRYRGAAVVSLSRVPCCVVPVHWARRTVPALTRVPRGDQPLNLDECWLRLTTMHGPISNGWCGHRSARVRRCWWMVATHAPEEERSVLLDAHSTLAGGGRALGQGRSSLRSSQTSWRCSRSGCVSSVLPIPEMQLRK